MQKIRIVDTHFETEDGRLFVPFGTTVYALLYQPQERIRQTLDSLYSSPFNKVRFCLFPKYYLYVHEEPEHFPFERNSDGHWDISKPDMVFWHRAENVVAELGAHGIQADLILFHPYDEGHWGFDRLSMHENRMYLATCIKYLGKYSNVWWSLANEYDLCAYKSQHDWENLAHFIRKNDNQNHLLSCHNGLAVWDCRRGGMTHASIQTQSLWRVPDWIAAYRKPVIIDECCYDGNLKENWGAISGKELMRRFWRIYSVGGYASHGETFNNSDGIIWWAKGGKLKGESIERIRFLRKIIEELNAPLVYKPQMSMMAAMSDPRLLKLVLRKFSPSSPISRLVCGFVPKNIRHYTRAVLAMDAMDVASLKEANVTYAGHVGEDAYLYYLYLKTSCEDVLELPKNHAYKIELIDPWNMTRQTLMESVCGIVTVKLTGTEDQVLLATRIKT